MLMLPARPPGAVSLCAPPPQTAAPALHTATRGKRQRRWRPVLLRRLALDIRRPQGAECHLGGLPGKERCGLGRQWHQQLCPPGSVAPAERRPLAVTAEVMEGGGEKCSSLGGWAGPGEKGLVLSCTTVVAPEDQATRA
eukprot:1157847-Pelagomonas_calceolata.AAC.2